MTITLLRGDARALPLPDASVDVIVTSPPYFALRSYSDGGEHYAGQVGSEATPAEFIEALIECTREMVRVLKPTGSIWVNLGDKYTGGGGQWAKDERPDPQARRVGKTNTGGRTYGYKPKSLLLLPERYRIACVDQLGLIARAVVIWSKPNGLPESVTDRVRRSHEDWVHLTKEPRYFSAVDEIRTPQASVGERHVGKSGHREAHPSKGRITERALNPLGKLPGSVWEIASQPLTVPAELGVDHFAAFPMEWPRRIILGWSPSGICVECGEGRRPVVEKPGLLGGDNNPHSRDGSRALSTMDGGSVNWTRRMANPDRITGYSCACPEPTAPTRPAVVLDPFGGTGTTALLADVLGRHGVSVDMSADYCRLAAWRTTDPKQRERASRPAASKRKPESPPSNELVEPELVEVAADPPIETIRLPRTADEWLAYFARMK
jgi:DNA modification methylase